MQKADSNSSAGYVADSSTKAENLFVSSHDTKPNVSGLPSLSEMSRFTKADESVKLKVSQILSTLKNVELLQAKEAVGIVSNYLFRVGQKSQEGLMLCN